MIYVPLEQERAWKRLVEGLEHRVANERGGFKNYLKSIKITGLKQLKQAEIHFDFPVVGLAGRNGSGKTTVLACATSAYSDSNSNIKPKRYYLSSLLPRTTWDNPTGRIDYTYFIDSEIKKGFLSCKSARWKNYIRQPKRQVRYFGNTRLVPKAEIRSFLNSKKKVWKVLKLEFYQK